MWTGASRLNEAHVRWAGLPAHHSLLLTASPKPGVSTMVSLSFTPFSSMSTVCLMISTVWFIRSAKHWGGDGEGEKTVAEAGGRGGWSDKPVRGANKLCYLLFWLNCRSILTCDDVDVKWENWTVILWKGTNYPPSGGCLPEIWGAYFLVGWSDIFPSWILQNLTTT